MWIVLAFVGAPNQTAILRTCLLISSSVGAEMGRGGLRLGAGRPGWRVKAEHCLRLEVRSLARRDMLDGGSFCWAWTNTATGKQSASIGITATLTGLTLDYSASGSTVRDWVWLERSPCNYGSTRPWFKCPRCSRRVGVLFMRGGRFMCRHCGQVSYGSQSEDALGRAWRRQYKLEARLGEDWKRPAGMHRTTHERILSRIFACEDRREQELAGFMARFGPDLGIPFHDP